MPIFFEAGSVVHIPASVRAFHCNLFAALSGHGQKGFPLQSRLLKAVVRGGRLGQ